MCWQWERFRVADYGGTPDLVKDKSGAATGDCGLILR
jgi:hypothetical protein